MLNLLAMGVAERICYGLTAVYFATFLQSTYELSLGQVALPLALFALGNIVGTIIGGQLADRLRDRMLTFAAAMAASGLVALALFGWQAGLVPTVALGFLYVFVNAIARPSLMAAMANVPDEVRGTVLGLNVTSASFGWLGAASLGGLDDGRGRLRRLRPADRGRGAARRRAGESARAARARADSGLGPWPAHHARPPCGRSRFAVRRHHHAAPGPWHARGSPACPQSSVSPSALISGQVIARSASIRARYSAAPPASGSSPISRMRACTGASASTSASAAASRAAAASGVRAGAVRPCQA